MNLSTYKITKEDNGIKLLDFLRTQLGEQFSARSIKRFLDQGWCRVNGKVERHSTCRLNGGSEIEIKTSMQAPTRQEWDDARILYEDASLIAYNKPAGLRSDGPGLAKLVTSYNSRAQLIHRLDKETSGVILFSKTEEAHDALLEEFRCKRVKKTYLAVVDGLPQQDSGKIISYLGPVKILEGQKRWGAVERNKGKEAITDWVCLAKGHDAALLECKPITGRTHQLRVHCAGMKHPILGDALYALRTRSQFSVARLLLHAHRITITHLEEDRPLELTAPLPNDFIKALTYIGYDLHHLS